MRLLLLVLLVAATMVQAKLTVKHFHRWPRPAPPEARRAMAESADSADAYYAFYCVTVERAMTWAEVGQFVTNLGRESVNGTECLVRAVAVSDQRTIISLACTAAAPTAVLQATTISLATTAPLLMSDDAVYRTTVDPAFVGTQDSAPGHLDRVDSRPNVYNGLYNYYGRGENITIYVVDTGIKPPHVEFTGRAV